MTKSPLLSMKAIVTVVLAMHFGSADFAAAAETTTAKREVSEASAAVRDYSYEQREAFSEWLVRQMSSLNERGDALKERATEAGETREREWQDVVLQISKKRQQVSQKAGELRRATPTNWEEAKQSAIAALKDLEDAYNQADSRLSPGG